MMIAIRLEKSVISGKKKLFGGLMMQGKYWQWPVVWARQTGPKGIIDSEGAVAAASP